MPYRAEETKSNQPSGADPSAKNRSVVTEKGYGSVQRPSLLSFPRISAAVSNAQKSLNAWHFRSSKKAGYSDREFEDVREL